MFAAAEYGCCNQCSLALLLELGQLFAFFCWLVSQGLMNDGTIDGDMIRLIEGCQMAMMLCCIDVLLKKIRECVPIILYLVVQLSYFLFKSEKKVALIL